MEVRSNPRPESPTSDARNQTLLGVLFGGAFQCVKSPAFWSIALFACSIVLLYLRLGTYSDMANWFTGDTLFPVHVAKDVLFDGSSLRGWNFCPSCFVFPDAIVAGIFFLVTGNAVLANFLTGVFFVTMTALGFCYCGHACQLGEARTRYSMIFIAAAAYVLTLASYPHSILNILFLPAFHSGAYTAIVWMTGILASTLYQARGTRRRIRLLCLLSVLAFFTAFGEPLILPMFVAAATAAGIVCRLGGLIERRQINAPIFMLWSVSLAGIFISRSLINITTPRVFAHPRLGNIWIALKNLLACFGEKLAAGDVMHWLGVTWIVVICGVLTYILRKRTINEDEVTRVAQGPIAFLLACFLFSALAMLAAPVVGGHNALVVSLNYEYLLHYLHPFIYGPIFGLPLLLAAASYYVSVPRLIQEWSGVTLGLPCLIAMIVVMTQTGIGDYLPHTGRTEFAVEIDTLIAKHNLRRGVTYFWKSRAINTMTQTEAETLPIFSTMMFCNWMNNSYHVHLHGIHTDEYIPFDFAITCPLEGLTRDLFIARFGEPAAIETIESRCIPNDLAKGQGKEDVELLVYNRPEDEKFHRFFDAPFSFPGYRERFEVRQLASDEAEDTPSQPLRPIQNESDVIALGTNTRLPVGEYSIAIQYAADDDVSNTENSRVDFGVTDEVAQSFKPLANSPLNSGDGETQINVIIAPEDAHKSIEARVHPCGEARVAIKSIELIRLR